MKIEIRSLRLRTYIGFQPWEKEKLQDVVITISFDFDGSSASRTDDVREAVDYKAITKRVIAMVEQAKFDLLETLSERILDLVMADPRVQQATVTVDKPHALRFADSVAVTTSRSRDASEVAVEHQC